MSLYKTWVDALEAMSPEQARKFFDIYYEKEKNVYAEILAKKESEISGTVSQLAERFHLEETETVGFIDGINSSLEKEIDLEGLTPDTEVVLTVNWEKLYLNMHKAKAPWLYGLEEWDGLLSEEERAAIAKEYKASLQAHTDHVGRNDPCPCGSGKKYKKCCGKAV